jgi:hypothetical protein
MGLSLIWASRLLSGSIRNRITGSDIFFTLNHRLDHKRDESVFFIGSTEESLSQISLRMAIDYPNIHVAGTYSPPFKPVYYLIELDAMIAAINIARPDVLWVGMTAPKQESGFSESRDRPGGSLRRLPYWCSVLVFSRVRSSAGALLSKLRFGMVASPSAATQEIVEKDACCPYFYLACP